MVSNLGCAEVPCSCFFPAPQKHNSRCVWHDQSYLKKSDLFLLPSESESFGLVALEAMSFGVPVITTSSGGVTELVMNNKNGFTCNVGDVNEMSNKSIKLLDDKKLYKSFSSNSFSTALKFDKTKIIPEYEKCYNKLLE